MKISIKNLGAIHDAEFELKPLTVFIGDNRQGKTQALHVATVMLGELGRDTYINYYLNDESARKIPEIEKIYKDLISTNHAEIDFVKFVKENTQRYLNALGVLAPSQTRTILGFEVTGTKPAVKFTLDESDLTRLEEDALDGEIQRIDSKVIIKTVKEKNNPTLHIYADENITLPKIAVMHTILFIIYSGIQGIIGGNVYQFPSERAGFTLLINRIQKLNINTNDEQKKKNDKSDDENILPYPLTNYMGLIHRSLMFGSLRQRIEQKEKNPKRLNWGPLVELFNKITGDEVILSKKEPEFPRKIQIKIGENSMDVQATSSGVKGLAGLALYLQYFSQKIDLIVIDEPEQNLHPTQQAKFIEFLTILVNNGIRVAITTHSPYIIEHLENLITAYDIKNNKEIVDKLYLKREDSFIDKNKVSAYLFENGTVKDILSDDGSINWQTFCDTANEIWEVTNLVMSESIKQKKSIKSQTTPDEVLAEDNQKYIG